MQKHYFPPKKKGVLYIDLKKLKFASAGVALIFIVGFIVHEANFRNSAQALDSAIPVMNIRQ